jgi:RNA polymerase sigma-70 factor (ECF subfamily)
VPDSGVLTPTAHDTEAALAKSSDEAIVAHILASGDTDAFGLLYDRYANKVYRKCLSVIKEVNTAQDLVHDIMVRVFTNLPKFKGNSKFGSWVYAITYNRCMDHLRKQQRVRVSEFDAEHDPRGGIEDHQPSYRELVDIRTRQLEALMDELHEMDRMVLLMKYQDELSVADMAETLDVGESAVKMRLKRARDRLQKLYEVRYPDDG